MDKIAENIVKKSKAEDLPGIENENFSSDEEEEKKKEDLDDRAEKKAQSKK